MYLFADHTTLTALNCSNINQDIDSLDEWLQDNKFLLNVDKTTQMNISQNAFNRFYHVPIWPVIKYFGIKIDNGLSFFILRQLYRKAIKQTVGCDIKAI